MSRAAELAREEAERVEREEAETDATTETTEPEPAPVSEPEPQGPPTPGPDEIRKAERVIERARKQLADLFGREAVAETCLLCSGMGHVPAHPPLGSMATIVQGEQGLELAWSEPGGVPADMPAAPDKQRCPDCDGYGVSLTGARAEAQMVYQCSRCNGQGFVPKPIDSPPAANGGYASPVSASVPPDYTLPATDAWGRPLGHQHYGTPPASIGV